MDSSTKSPWASLSSSADVMASESTLLLLEKYSRDAAHRGGGTIVEIGAYRGGSTIALAKGISEVGRGTVFSIDPHASSMGIYGGEFSSDDHEIYSENIRNFGVAKYVEHLCMDSESASIGWTKPIDLLWVDGDHKYDAVARDIMLWVPMVGPNGVVIFDDVLTGSEVEAAIGDHLPFSRFCLVERVGSVVVFRRVEGARILYLCGGLQSSGSTLVSWSFLQRQGLDGVLDMENSRVQQDFSKVHTESTWLKMTIGSFRLGELVSLFEAQGWIVKPILVKRSLLDIYRSLREKPYGIDGTTGDEPPILIRFQRYLLDLELAGRKQWTVLEYGKLISDPRLALTEACIGLDLPWDEAMLTWPKADEAIAYGAHGNSTFHETKSVDHGLFEAIDEFRAKSKPGQPKVADPMEQVVLAMESVFGTEVAPPSANTAAYEAIWPSKYRGTRRQVLEKRLEDLEIAEIQLTRVLNHIVFGPLLVLWRRLVNSTFPAKK